MRLTTSIRQVVLDVAPLFREQYGCHLADQLLADRGLAPYMTGYLNHALFDCVIRQGSEGRKAAISDADCREALWRMLEFQTNRGDVRAVLIAMHDVRFTCTWRVPEDEPVYVRTCPLGTDAGPNLFPVPDCWSSRI